MKIGEIFSKPIDREIKGVIKVPQAGGESEDQNAQQELEEYVVTNELAKHFSKFFSAYKKGIDGKTDKIGVWISGFFGSGKSHFLKMLAYLLENKTVGGKSAVRYFKDGNKITDPMVLADMELCADKAKDTDVILFNIDSKSDQSGKDDKDRIVDVFLKVFNEKMGFCGSIPHLANLERNLSENGKYEDFKKRYQSKFNERWEDSRHKFDFIFPKVVDILVEMNVMSREDAQIWAKKALGNHTISIEEFAKLVKDHIDKMENDHHVVFLVDEAGQYIGTDSNLMLNLQTVTEDLGSVCEGKAWIIVTSQQNIDEIAKNMGRNATDFSKIQGRFDTRISLSTANVDEVIKRRILEKNTTAESALAVLYEQKETTIKNLLPFSRDSAEMKLYADKKDFISVYPFVPYQFDLLGKVLTSIRNHGASGKHLSDGARSMLALFKESAEAIRDDEIGAVVPFNLFYDALHQFLDHSHAGVIERAYKTDAINPDKSKQCFAVNLLKALFMVKYVKEIAANVEDLTSLMVSSIYDDRISVRQDVERDLKTLIGQKLVQKNGDVYVFLTDEEQDINRNIEQQTVDNADIIKAVSDRIFDDIYKNTRFKYLKHNGKYTFAFDQSVDDRSRKPSQSFEIAANIITPYNDVRDETALRLASDRENKAYIVLPEDQSFLDEIREALKIDKFLRTGLTGVMSAEEIRIKKGNERTKRIDLSKTLLIEALRNASIYVGGKKVEISSKDVATRIDAALEKLVDRVYNKLSYIDTPKSESDIQSLINNRDGMKFDVVGDKIENSLAIKEIADQISANSKINKKESLKNLIDRFTKAPYGFDENDIKWIVAKLFLDGNAALLLNGQTLNTDHKKSELVSYLTKKDFIEKLQIDRKKRAADEEKKAVREVFNALFHEVPSKDDDDSLWSAFRGKVNDLSDALIKCQSGNSRYPGKETIAKGRDLLREIIQASQSEFFGIVSVRKNDFIEFAEAYEPLRLFHSGTQKEIFDQALWVDEVYNDSKVFINSPGVDEIHKSILLILDDPEPYRSISKLPVLIKGFNEEYDIILNVKKDASKNMINEAKERVMSELSSKPFKEELENGFGSSFTELYNELDSCKNIAVLSAIDNKAEKLKLNLLDRIDSKATQSASQPTGDGQPSPKPAVQKTKRISAKEVTGSTWKLKNKDEVDAKVEELRKKLKEKLENDTTLHVEF